MTEQLNSNNSPKLARRRGKNGSEAGKERGQIKDGAPWD